MTLTAVHRPPRLVWGFAACVGLLACAAVASLAVGARSLPMDDVVRELFAYSGSEAGQIVRTVRIPRTVLGIVVGIALGVAGALMQALTRNPLADPGLLGVNAGAAAAVVLGIMAGVTGFTLPLALLGSGVAALVVVLLGGFGGAGAPAGRLVLAGAAVSASLTGLVAGLTLIDQNAFDHYRFWVVGTLADQPVDALGPAAPVLVIGLVCGLTVAKALDILSIGDDGGTALGVNLFRTRLAGLLAVVLLCGAATSLVGPIGFLGLAVPHAARLICGPRLLWILAYSVVLGPLVLLVADIVGRLVARPGEIEVAIVMGVIGAPIFLALVRGRAL